MTTVSKTEFAALYGCSKAYVSQLVASKRIVLDADGKRVDVERSFELLGVTSDPSKAGVRERWDAYRSGRAAPSTATTAAVVPSLPLSPAVTAQLPLDAPPAPAPAAAEPVRSAYHDARTKKEEAQARMAELDLGKQLGELLEAEPTLRAVMDAHLAARTELMMLPDRLAQLVAPEIDPRKCYDLIRVECERACQRMVEASRGLANAEALARASALTPAEPAAVTAEPAEALA